MLIGSVLLALAVLVVIAGAVCWLAGVQLVAVVKLLLAVFAVCFTLAGAAVVTGDLLQSAGYINSGRPDSGKQAEVTPAPAGYTPPEPLTEEEQQRLHWLHRSSVEIFIARPGFGLRRMPLSVEEFITSPKSLSRNDAANRRPLFGAPVVIADPEKPGEKPAAFHYPVQDLMDGWGMGQIPTEDKKELWKLRKVHLVGLVKHPEPVVYLTDKAARLKPPEDGPGAGRPRPPGGADKVPDMKPADDVPTRGLDAFEKAALESLRGGEDLKAEKRGKQLRALGPIYAGAACVKCHDHKGQLLGAFTYTLERVPAPPEADAPEKEFPPE
jgi:hypothetical protein